MNYTKFVVSFAGYESVSTGYHRRRVRRPKRLYITKVSFGTNNTNNLLSKWWFNDKREDAHLFSKVMAEDIQKFLKSQRFVNVQVEPEKIKEEVTI